MKRVLFLTAISLIVAGSIFSQENIVRPARIVKAAYFDKTPPLREMPVILPGERQRQWKDNVIENPSLEQTYSEELIAKFGNAVDPVVQTSMGSLNSRGPILSFDGVSNVNSVYPPDTDGEVGPDHYFQMINLSFAIWDKTGFKLYGPVDNSTLWQGFIGPWTGTNDGDPIILYDHLADRWVASQFAIHTNDGTYWELVAVSVTGDPLGEYYRYAFEFPAFNDYPKLSVWPDGYYATFNMFGGQVRGAVSAFEREKMITGDPDAQMVYFDMWGTFSLQPADVDGPAPPEGAPNYVAHRRTWNDQNLEIYEFMLDWTNPGNSSITLVADLETLPHNSDVGGIPQPGTGVRLDDLAVMLMHRLQYRNFTDYEVLLTNHTVKVNNHAAIRWYELRKEEGDWYIYQQGTYAPDNENRWMGSIAMNGQGEIALGYSVSSSSTYPSIRFTGRSPDAPLGEMDYEEKEMAAGTGSQTILNRWGDYSCMTVDPVDDYTFWYTQEYTGQSWTRIGAFDFGPVMPPQIDAGEDEVICDNQPFLAKGSGLYVNTVLWSSSGDGTFVPDPPTNMRQVYLRGPGDLEAGAFTLYVYATGYEPGLFDTDSVRVTILNRPTSYAGEDTTICFYTPLTLAGEVTNASAILWFTDGDGTFDDPSILNATYTPGPQDVDNGSVKLSLRAFPIDPCENTKTDQVKVTLDPCTGITDRQEENIQIHIIPNPASVSFEVRVQGVKQRPYVIHLLNQAGERIFTKQGTSGTSSLSEQFIMSYQPKGVYFIEIHVGDESRLEKVIIQ